MELVYGLDTAKVDGVSSLQSRWHCISKNIHESCIGRKREIKRNHNIQISSIQKPNRALSSEMLPQRPSVPNNRNAAPVVGIVLYPWTSGTAVKTPSFILYGHRGVNSSKLTDKSYNMICTAVAKKLTAKRGITMLSSINARSSAVGDIIFQKST